MKQKKNLFLSHQNNTSPFSNGYIEGTYIAEIDLMNNMRSTYNRTLNFIQDMDGTADIITEESRLIYKFIRPLQVKKLE